MAWRVGAGRAQSRPCSRSPELASAATRNSASTEALQTMAFNGMPVAARESCRGRRERPGSQRSSGQPSQSDAPVGACSHPQLQSGRTAGGDHRLQRASFCPDLGSLRTTATGRPLAPASSTAPLEATAAQHMRLFGQRLGKGGQACGQHTGLGELGLFSSTATDSLGDLGFVT